ncbi:MAG: DUF1501 domain-containing protein [Nannocystaceae bacterium]
MPRLDRRSFLKFAGLTGLGVAAPLVARRALADTPPYPGPYFVLIHAGGGWDPIYLCDPKPMGPLNRIYGGPASAGNIAYAPIAVDAAALGLDPSAQPYLMSNQAFFEKYGPRLTVMNGVDTSTNNHDGGTRASWSGRLEEGYPSFGAITAAIRSPGNPLAYISSGGYDVTDGLVPLTRMGSLDALRKVAYPDILYPDDPESGVYLPKERMDRIRAAQRERLMAMQGSQRLPRGQAAMSELFLAREDDNALAKLVFPGDLVELNAGYQLSDLQYMMQQTQLALAAFQAGLAVAVNLNLGGFDTHANHDRDQVAALAKLLYGVDFLMSEADKIGIGGQLVVVIASDFARGPGYNADNEYGGKDHWPVTSAMAMGPGIAGDRVVGATDDAQQALPWQGSVITPSHVHRSLRTLAGIDSDEITQRYPLAGDDLPIFG